MYIMLQLNVIFTSIDFEIYLSVGVCYLYIAGIDFCMDLFCDTKIVRQRYALKWRCKWRARHFTWDFLLTFFHNVERNSKYTEYLMIFMECLVNILSAVTAERFVAVGNLLIGYNRYGVEIVDDELLRTLKLISPFSVL